MKFGRRQALRAALTRCHDIIDATDMGAITILRPDITSDEVVDVLCAALGPSYRVARSGADEVKVEAGPSRAGRAVVRVDPGPDRTVLTVRAGALAIRRPSSRSVARRVRRVLHQSAELRMPGWHARGDRSS